MKLLATAATGFALLATSAVAETLPALNDKDTVTLNAMVGEYLAITDTSNNTIGDLDISQDETVAANNNVDAGVAGKATFEVTSNVDYDMDLKWKTWTTAGAALPAGAPTTVQAYYFNNLSGANCAIGGTVSFDPDPTDGDSSDVQRGTNNAPFSPSPSGTLAAFERGIATYGVNTEAAPNVTNCTDNVAAPGTYSLDVEITVSKA